MTDSAVAIVVVSFCGQTRQGAAMKTFATTIAFALLAASPALAAEAAKDTKDTKDAAKKTAPAKSEAMSVNGGDIKWGEDPPDLPSGAQLAVLHGDPSKKATFTLRLKMPPGYKIPPHWHTRDEQLTIVSGAFVLHMGDTMEAPASTLTAGGFHFLPGKMHHAAETTEETIVQVDGMGPFDIHYLNAADNPNPKSAAAASKK
jgi:quercetin dioxygenase-like cupin family protein